MWLWSIVAGVLCGSLMTLLPLLSMVGCGKTKVKHEESEVEEQGVKSKQCNVKSGLRNDDPDLKSLDYVKKSAEPHTTPQSPDHVRSGIQSRAYIDGQSATPTNGRTTSVSMANPSALPTDLQSLNFTKLRSHEDKARTQEGRTQTQTQATCPITMATQMPKGADKERTQGTELEVDKTLQVSMTSKNQGQPKTCMLLKEESGKMGGEKATSDDKKGRKAEGGGKTHEAATQTTTEKASASTQQSSKKKRAQKTPMVEGRTQDG